MLRLGNPHVQQKTNGCRSAEQQSRAHVALPMCVLPECSKVFPRDIMDTKDFTIYWRAVEPSIQAVLLNDPVSCVDTKRKMDKRFMETVAWIWEKADTGFCEAVLLKARHEALHFNPYRSD